MNFWQFLRRWRLSLSAPTNRRSQKWGWRPVPRRKLPVALGLELLEDRVVPAPLSPGAVLAANGVTIFNEGDPSAKIQVALDIPSTKPVTISYAATGGSALQGVDYRLPAGKITFAPGQTVQSAPLDLLNDPLIHGNVTIQVTLSKPVNATLQTATAVYTIIDTEPLPAVSFQQASASGPESQNGKLTAMLSAKSGQTVTVAYAVTGGSATAGTDYKPFGGTLTFTPGQTSQTITIPVIDDKHNGDNQTVQVSLSAPANATLGATATATYTIQNNNPAPTVSFQQASASGPQSKDASLVVALSAASDKTVTVSYAAAGGTAVAGTDYTLPQPQTLTFTPGVLTESIPVHLIDNGQPGPNKTLRLLLSGPANATLGKTTAETFTIIDNEPLPTVSFQQAAASGPESQDTSLVVTLSAASDKTVTVNYAASGTAVAGTNYTLPQPQTLTFTPGVLTQSIPVHLIGNGQAGPNKTLRLLLSAPANASLGKTTAETFTIIDNEPLPTVSFQQAAASGAESQNGKLTAVLSARSVVTVTVAYAVTGGSATAGTDYKPFGGTLTFTPGQTSQTITIPVLDDKHNGDNHTVQVTLSAPANATLGATATATYTIQNNNPAPTVSFQQAKGSGPESQDASLVVALSAASDKTVTVSYAASGTAAAGTNYTLPQPQTLTFTPGVLTQAIPVHLIDNGQGGPNKTLRLLLSAPANASLGKTTAETFTIIDNEPLPTASFQQASVSGAESQNGKLTVVLSAKSVVTVTVAYAVTGGSASAGTDYKPFAGTLTFQPGQTSQTITIPVLDDKRNGNNQTVQVTLSAPANATLGATVTATYTIQNNNPAPTVSFQQASASGPQSEDASLVVTLSAASDKTVTVGYTASGTAVAGTDYTLPVSSVTFAPGVVSQSIPLDLINTHQLGSNKTLSLQLSAPVGATLGKTAAETYTIIDNVPSVGFDLTPPVLTVLTPTPGLITASNVTVTGTALDAFSGLASLTAAVDGGSAVNVPVATTGAFSFTTQLSLVSTSDGTHTVQLVATDKVGNVASVDVSFVLDTAAPVLTLTSPAAGLVTNAASVTVAGQADGHVAGLASLQAQVDGGTPFAVSFDSSGNFSFGVATAALADGTHTVSLSATDKAGNTGTTQVTFTLDTHPPTIVIQSPTSGSVASGNVTVTGQVTDALSGVASFEEAVDGGAYAPLTFDPSTGNFTFTTALPLDGSADGPHTVAFEATDKAGNVSPAVSLSFTLVTISQLPTPVLDPASDSGPGQDGITNVTTPLIHEAAPTGLTISLFVDGQLAQQVASVKGSADFKLGPLADGTYSIVAAVAGLGGSFHSNSKPLSITILTTPPPVPTFDLAAGTADLGPENTDASHVTLVGQAGPGDTVTLVGTSLSGLASGNGTFQIPGVTLVSGANVLTLQAEDLAGNTTSSAPLTVTYTPPTTGTPPNAVIVWNQATLNAIQTDGTDPLMASRALAMVQAAVYDAVNNVEGMPAYYVKIAAPADSSVNAAVDAAAHDVLGYLYPAQQATFDALLTSQLALLPAGQGTTDGETVGQAVGNAIIAMRANDGAKTFDDFEPGTAPGDWQPTAPAFAPALDPQGGNMTPWAMTSDSQFDPAGPPALTSQQWADAVNQIESLGAVNSTTRTAAETTLAQFWNDGIGTPTPSGHWNAIAQTVAEQEGDSLVDDARLFAELNVSMADAGIATWNTKYLYDTWRPITVIQSGGDGVNPAVTADPTWTSLLTNPNFPEYVSGHSAFSMAAATVLDSFFGDNVTFTTTEPTTTLSLTYTSFMQAATDAGMSRLYGGIHFLFSIQDGWTVGEEVAKFDLATFSVSRDTTPPKVNLNDVLPSGASNTNVTITGQVTDNLSGVAALAVQIDGGAYAPLSFDATTGNFSFTTSFALNGSADGSHTIDFQATNNAGIVAAPVPFTFTLATQAPTLTLTSPTDDSTLTAGENLTGTVSTDAGVPIVCLCYAFDGSTTMTPVAFSDGTFSQALDLSQLTAGSHTLLVEAQDAAGNTTTQTLNLTLAAPIPLAVTNITPAAGSSDVGVTFRPIVTFSRPIDTTTLNSSDFYATDTTGAKIAATIVSASDDMSATMFFTNPLPGSSTLTLTVDGSTIKAADGSLLDAAGDGTPGSTLTSTFTTVSTAAVPGTSISGIVADPGPDGQPGTRDDVRAGPDGIPGTADDIYLNPIAGATVYILGLENEAVTSGADGSFTLTNIPAGDVKLVIDGTTATNAPSGVYYPQMVFDLTVQPGVANTVMGDMGTLQEQQAMGTSLGVYLPRLQKNILQPAGGDTATTITLNPDAATSTLTAQQASEYSITVAPNSIIGMNGQPMPSAMVGISTVNPSLIRDMLPQGVMQLATTLTIQAPGVATFTTPLQVTFANVYGAAPGSQLDVYSFNHTTGELEITGTATVSPDGKTVTTNPGSGITHPGWFGVTPPGTTLNVNAQQPNDKFANALEGDAAAVFTGALSALQTGFDATLTRLSAGASGILGVVLGSAQLGVDYQVGSDSNGGQSFGQWNLASQLTVANDVIGIGLSAGLVIAGTAVAAGVLAVSSPVVVGLATLSTVSAIAGIVLDVGGVINSLGDIANSVNGLDPAGTYPSDQLFQAQSDLQAAQTTLMNLSNAYQDVSMRADGAFSLLIGNALQQIFGSQLPNLAFQFASGDEIEVLDASTHQPIIDSKTGDPMVLTTADILQHLSFQPQQPSLDSFLGGEQLSQSATLIQNTDPADLASQFDQAQSLVQTAYTRMTEPASQVYYDVQAGVLNLRGMTDPTGQFSAFLAPNTAYTVSLFDPQGLLYGSFSGTTGASGSVESPALPVILTLDTNNLESDVAQVLGTTPTTAQLAQLEVGVNPFVGTVFPTGVVAQLPLQGQAEQVVLEGSTLSSQGQTAYVATGSYGLAIVNASSFESPVLLGQIQLPGDSVGIAVDSQLNIAAVASSTGLNLVDVSDPTHPKLLQTLDIPAEAVKIDDGVAYVANGAQVTMVDLLTGDTLDQESFSGGTVDDLSITDGALYVLASEGYASHTVYKVDLNGLSLLAPAYSLTITGHPTFGQMYLFAGGGYVYVGASDNNDQQEVPGVEVIQDTGTALNYVGPSSAITAFNVTVNSNALALYTGGLQFSSEVGLLDLSDPTTTDKVLTTFDTPGTAEAIAIGEGIGFVADGSAGLAVLNYLPFDTTGIPPTVSASLPASAIVGTDGTTPEVIEGSTVPLDVTATSDVQVRNVELLVNGQVVQNAVTFPFDLSAALPTIAQNGSNTVTIQVLAYDTGGNVGSSSVLTVELVKDTVPPALVGSNLPEGARESQNFRSVVFEFSKPLDPSTVTASTFQLVGPNGVVAPVDIEFRNHNATVQLTYPTLAVGSYQLVIDAPDVTTPAGIALGASNITRDFSIVLYSAVWINPNGGDWSDPSNWQSGVLPGPTDDVLIDVTGSPTITFSQGQAQVQSILATDPFQITGGTLEVDGRFEADGGLELDGGTLTQAVLVAGSQTALTVGTYSDATLDGVTLDSDLTVQPYATLTIVDGLQLNANLNVAGGNNDNYYGYNADLIFQGTQNVPGTGQIILGTSTPAVMDVDSNSDGSPATLTLGAGITVEGQGTIGNLSSTNNALVNQGTIAANTAGETLALNIDFTNPGTIQVANKATLTLGGTLTLADLQNISVTGSGQVWIANDNTYGGGLDNTNNTLSLDALPSWLGFGPQGRIFNGTVSANSTFTLPAGWDLILDGVTNQADLDVGEGATLTLDGAWAQAGTLIVTGGTLNLGGDFHFADLGNFSYSSGSVNLTGTLENSGQTLALDDSTGSWNLQGGTIVGGTITAAGSAQLTLTDSDTPSGTLDGVTLQTDLTVSQNATLTVLDGLELDADLTVEGGNANNYYYDDGYDLLFQGTQTISGTGEIDLGTVVPAAVALGDNPDGSEAALTVGPSITLQGQGTIGGYYYYDNLQDNGALINQGLIAVTTAGQALEIDSDLHNTGQIQVGDQDTLTLGGTLTPADLQGLTVSGSGAVVLTGTLDNTGGTLDLDQLPAALTYNGGQILNGTLITGTGSYTVPAGSNLTLNGVTLAGTVIVGPGTTLTLDGSWTNTGTLEVSGGTLNLGGDFTLADLGTLIRSGGTINLTGTLDASASGLVLDASTGSWNLLGGTLLGGTYSASGGAELVFTSQGGTLDGVTAASDLDLATTGGTLNILDGLTLDQVTVFLGNGAGSTSGQMEFGDTETLGGTGSVVFGTSSSNAIEANTSGNGDTLTIGPSITIQGSSGSLGDQNGNGTIVNEGTIAADGSGANQGGYGFDTDFGGDSSYTGSTADAIDTSGVSNPAPPSVWQTYRTGYDFTYTLPGLTAGASYTVNLDFADPDSTAAGQRQFDVSINGSTVLTDFDIYATAGGQDKAVVQSFTATADSNGNITIEFSYDSGYPLVNGITVQDSGGNTVLAINCGELAGGTLTINGDNGGTFENQGTLTVSNGETLSIGSAWTNAGGATITATGATLDLGDQSSSSTNAWSNAGTISATDSKVNLGGLFTIADLGTLERTNSTVNLVGTVDASASGLALDASTGSWNLAGGTVKGGTYTAAGGAELVFTNQGGTLDGVTAASNLDLATTGGTLNILDGLTLDQVTVFLGNGAGSTSGQMEFGDTETLGGTGTVVFGSSSGNAIEANTSGNGDTLTIGSGITIQGNSGSLDSNYYYYDTSGDTIINEGTIAADGSGANQDGYAYDIDFGGDSSYTGSTANAIDTSGVSDPAPQSVWQTYRTGYDFTYTLPGLTAGASYTVALDFADPDSTAAGQRLFDVSSNGSTVLSDFDIYATAGGQNKAVVQSFTATADSNGQITIEFSYDSGNYYPLVNGITVQDSGGNTVQAIDCGELAGGTLTINSDYYGGTFENQGTLAVSNGETLNVSGLTGNLGTATLNGSGSQLTLNGSNYVINQGLTVSAGQTLTLDGAWSNASGSTIGATGATLNLGDQSSSSTNAWSNAGTISTTDSTVNLGGTFTLGVSSTITRSGGTVNLVGTLDASASGLALDATTGSWNLLGGTLLGGTYTASGGAELVFTNQGGTLDGVTAASDLDLASNYGVYAYVTDGLTLDNATVLLGNGAGSTYGTLYFSTTETLGGTGTVLFGKSSGSALYETGDGDTLTIGPNVTVRGSNGTLGSYYGNSSIVNQGTITADDSGGQAGDYAYDSDFSGDGYAASTANAIDTSGVTDPAPPSVWQTYRTGYDFTYTLPGLTAGASYTVNLGFADPSATGAGQRLFDVSINGSTVLSDFDVYATAGGQNKAVVQSFTATADSNGNITIEFSYDSGNYYPLVNGITVQDAGGNTVLAINCGELAGGTLTINPGTFQNQGTLAVSNGETMNVSGVAGNLGTATLSGSGSQLALSGSNYAINEGLTVAAGETLSLAGTWSNAAGSTIGATGATLNLGDESSSSTNAWSNAGTISVTNSTANLGGTFTLADLGTFNRSGGTVNLVGILDASASGLALNSTTGSWNLLGGTLLGGTYTASGGAELVFTNQSGTLDGVTVASDLDLASNYGVYAYVTDGLTLNNATVLLGNGAGSTYGQLYFSTTETLSGTGTVLFGKSSSNALYETGYGDTLTLGPNVTLRGSSGTISAYYGNNTIINQGSIAADDSGGQAGGYAYDTDFSGGYAASTEYAIDTSGVSDPAPPSVWQTYRTGYDFTYTLPGLTAGASYTVNLGFADPSATGAGQRLFDVSSNGSTVLSDFDVYATAGGQDKAVVQSFTATADSNGNITIEFSYDSGNYYPLVNGITVQDSGGNTVLAIDCGELAGGTLTVNPGTFQNQGTLAVSNGETMNVSGLTGNLGTATLSGSGSQLTLNGSNYVINQGLTATAGQTLTLSGTWSNAAGSTIGATGATLNLGDQSSSSTNAWSNAGTISASDSTINLGGLFTIADLGTFPSTGDTVNLVGTVDASASGLTLNSTTGSWNLVGGTLLGGIYTASGGAELVFTNQGGTLDGVTANSDLDLASNNDASVSIVDGLTLNNATALLGNGAGSTYGQLYFSTTETLGGTGTVLFGKSSSNALYETGYGDTLTLGPNVTLRGSSGTISAYYGNGTIINQGTISADDSGGTVAGFVYDTDFSYSYTGSTAEPIDTSGVTDPAPQSVWQTYRYYPDFTYTLPGLTAGASYSVALDFADPSATGAGQRLFDVIINGSTVLSDFDIYATAGGQDKAVVQSFTATADSNGNITIEFSYDSGNYYPLVNGITVQDSGGNTVLAINCGELAGGTLTVNPGTFQNQGTLTVSNGETMNVSGLTGNLGTATLSGSGSQLTLNGSNYVVNQGLTIAAGQMVYLLGNWSNAANSTISVTGATLVLGDQPWLTSSLNAWSNAGTISATNSQVNLGGSFTVAALGNFQRSGGSVYLTGTLDDTGTGLALTSATGSWILYQGTLKNGTYSASGGAELVFTNQGGTLDGVTANSDLDLASNDGADVSIVDGLTLDDATIYLGNGAGSTDGQLYFSSTETLGGTGTVLFGKNSSNALYETGYGDTLTIGPNVTLRGSSGTLGSYYGNSSIVNQGSIAADDSGGQAGDYAYDTDFSGGSYAASTANTIDTSGVSNPAPPSVWQTYRTGSDFTYTLPGLTAGASYTIALDFADLSSTAAGQRLFDVIINGSTVLSDFDIYATAGGQDKAVVQSFTATADSNGNITIEFSYDAGNYYPLVNGITVQDGGGNTVQAINCGELAGGTLTVNPGTFQNQGTVEAVNGDNLSITNLQPNAGTIYAGAAGAITINGDFTQTSTGVVNIDLGGTDPSQFGQIAVTGAATLSGTLNIGLVNGFTPASGQSFLVMSWASESGSFATVNNPPGATFTLSYDPSDLTLVVN